VPFGGKNEIDIYAFYAPKVKFWQKGGLKKFWPKSLYNGDAYLHVQMTLNRHRSAIKVVGCRE